MKESNIFSALRSERAYGLLFLLSNLDFLLREVANHEVSFFISIVYIFQQDLSKFCRIESNRLRATFINTNLKLKKANLLKRWKKTPLSRSKYF